jgi:putative protease
MGETSSTTSSPGFERPEIVSPAGNEDSFWAAIEAGADAVYLGVKEFNARRRAENFELSKLPHLIREAHLRKKKVYVALNILIKNDELREALSIAEKVLEASADAIILQDLGFAFALRETFEGVRLHASTQINAHSIPSVRFLLESGFKRVVLSRELSIPDIEKIIAETGVEAEVFVHGALCYSYSGQCLFSSVVGGRSGNRGLCAQPCRLPYEFSYLEKASNSRKVIGLPYSYILSTKDLFALNHLPSLISAGVKALKIEGRLKSAEYVYLVTSVYAEELKRALELKKGYEPTQESIQLLEEAFSRGFSDSYLEGRRGNSMMSYTRPNNRGSLIGRVVYVDNLEGRVGVNLKKDLHTGDVLEFWTSKKGKVTQKVKELFGDSGKTDIVPAGERAHLVVEKDRHLIRPGDRVYRVLNEPLLRKLRESRRARPSGGIELSFKVVITEDGKATVTSSADSVEIAFEERIAIERAQKAETSREIVAAQFEKLGGTPYVPGKVDVEIPKGVHIRLKELNKLRRKAVELINEKRLKHFSVQYRRKGDPHKLLTLRLDSRKTFKATPGFAVKVADKEILDAVIPEKPDIIYLRFPFLRHSGFRTKDDLFRAFEYVRNSGLEFGVALPAVLKDRELEEVEEILLDLRDCYVLTDNLGVAYFLSDKKFRINLDYHANFFNSLYENALERLSVRGATLSVELNEDEIIQILQNVSLPISVLIAGDIEIMVAEHCPLMALYGTGELDRENLEKAGPCTQLAREGYQAPKFCEIGHFFLKDRIGYEFPVRSDSLCRGYIYNSKILCALSLVTSFYEAGATLFRADFLSPLTTKEDVVRIVRNLRKIVDELKAGREPSINDEDICHQEFTRGHFKRGVA